MKKLFNVYQGKTLITTLFADTCEPAVHGLGLFVRGCSDLTESRCTIDKPDLTVVQDTNRARYMLVAYTEAYRQGKRDDAHGHFASILGCTRYKAKETCYEILYRGCCSFVKVHD